MGQWLLLCMLLLLTVLQAQAIRIKVVDEQGKASVSLGSEGGPIFSSTGTDFVACSYVYGYSDKHPGAWSHGKCTVFGETTAGVQDWGAHQVHLIDDHGVSSDHLGGSRPDISHNGQHVVACIKHQINHAGKCVVFSETNPGDRDWDMNQQNLTDNAWGSGRTRLGYGGAKFSLNDQHIVACAYASLATDDAKCIIFSASAPGNADWGAQQAHLVDNTAAQGGYSGDTVIGEHGARFSADAVHVIACSQQYNNDQGKCIVWSETTPGVSQDWNNNQVELFDANYDGSGQDYFGELPGTFTSDAQHIVICARGYSNEQGKCIIFSASAPGNTDWNDNQAELIDAANPAVAKMGWDMEAYISQDDTHISICAIGYESFQGKCIIWSETNPGDADWEMNPVWLLDPNGAGQDVLNSLVLTSDNRHAIACSPGYSNGKGKCLVFSETELGTRDWQNNVETLTHNYGYANIGLYAIALSPDDKTFAACGFPWELNQGLCVVWIPESLADQCDSSPCNNNGNCTDLYRDFNCSCPEGTEGRRCTAIDDCAALPCQNGATCMDHGIVPNSFNCTCLTGYTGTFCELDIDDCLTEPCLYNGTCSDDGTVPNEFNCTCTPGYTGAVCAEDIDDCTLVNLCANTGTCSDDGSVPNSYNCSCDSGYTGVYCTEDIDDCASAPCGMYGVCNDTGTASFQCTCTEGYNGTLCANDFNDCVSNPCLNGGQCVDDGVIPSAFNCSCPPKYSGILCELVIPVPTENLCVSSPCLNGGVCSTDNSISPAALSCNCTQNATGFAGVFCEEALDQKIVFVRIPTDYFPPNTEGEEFSLSQIRIRILAELTNGTADVDASQVEVIVQKNETTGVYEVTIVVTSADGVSAEDVSDSLVIPDTWELGPTNGIVVVDPPDEDPPEETATSDELLGLTVMVLIGLVLLVALCGVAYAVKKKRSTVQAVAKYNMAK